ncbi:MAG: hypothetical protein Q4C91_00910 [Eubacteriales bacterium]|nr:hypothetical protein [Eubacteriales bacterium]
MKRRSFALFLSAAVAMGQIGGTGTMALAEDFSPEAEVSEVSTYEADAFDDGENTETPELTENESGGAKIRSYFLHLRKVEKNCFFLMREMKAMMEKKKVSIVIMLA